MYEGAWVDGKAMGQGLKKLANGTIFEGQWEDSDFLEGKCQYPDGQIYVGQWNNGKPEGLGVRTWPDGRVYDGRWLQGKPIGQGIKTYIDKT